MAEDTQAQLVNKEEEQRTFNDTGMLWLLIILMLILLAFAVTILGPRQDPGGIIDPSSSPVPTEFRQPRIYTVSYRSGVFSPTNLRIHAGDTVRFRNDGSIPLRVIGGDPAVPGFDSIGDIQPGSIFGVTFANTGTFRYHNQRIITEAGTIIVR